VTAQRGQASGFQTVTEEVYMSEPDRYACSKFFDLIQVRGKEYTGKETQKRSEKQDTMEERFQSGVVI
jgi:hypothetical protein